jgi:hypothetical protein
MKDFSLVPVLVITVAKFMKKAGQLPGQSIDKSNKLK